MVWFLASAVGGLVREGLGFVGIKAPPAIESVLDVVAPKPSTIIRDIGSLFTPKAPAPAPAPQPVGVA